MIKLVKSTFYNEKETKKTLKDFITNSKQLSIGEECRKFEKAFAKYQGRKYCVMVNSGSSANLAIVQALLNTGKLKKGDAVGFSAITWSTNVMPLFQLGLTPIPIDVELDTLNVSSKCLTAVLKKTDLKMLFITNLLGFCDDIDEIRDVCKKRKIILIEDNCESLGTVYKGEKLGNFGLASTFSFYVGHHMSTIEGGAICTDDPDIETMLQMVRAHGWDRNLTEKRQLKVRTKHGINSAFYSRYTFYDLGYNFRATEINGLIGNIQLKYINEIVKKRRDNFLYVADSLYKNNKYYPIKFNHIDFISNFAVPIICKSSKIRDNLIKKCEGVIEIRPIVGGDMTRQPFFQKYMPMYANFTWESNAKLINENGLYFGNNPDLTDKELKTIIKVFHSMDNDINKKAKIYIAGHRGLVGSAITRKFQQEGYSNLLLKTRKELDLFDQRAVLRFFEEEKPDYVILAAARVGGIKENMTHQADFIYENVQIQNNVIWSAYKNNVKKLLFLGSSCIYPRECPQPMKEVYFMEGKVEPTNEGYAMAKIMGMKLCEKIYEQYGLTFISCMPTNVYGEHDTFDLNASHVIPALIRRIHEAHENGTPEVIIWGSGKSRREFLYMDDLADAVYWLLQEYKEKDFLNVGTGEDVSIKELANIIKEMIGYKGKLAFDITKPDGMPRKLLDVGKINKIGWKHKVGLKSGLERTYAWYKKNITTANAGIRA